MTDNKDYNISVRELVEFTLRTGNLDSTNSSYSMSNERAVLGTRIHCRIEKKLAENGSVLEVMLSDKVKYNGFNINISGRADAVNTSGSTVVIEEIKSTETDLNLIESDYNFLHQAQAMVYAYMYNLKFPQDKYDIKLIYCNIETENTKEFVYHFTSDELSDFYNHVVNQYMQFIMFIHNWKAIRNDSIKNVKFPFPKYRDGQRELAVSVYKTIKSENKLFAQAPTGTGKTMSSIFPALKALGEGLCDKIFYLTAKTTTRALPRDAVNILMSSEDKPLKLISTTLYAKEKICPCEETVCEPEACPYAKGHYDRINKALLDALKNEKMFDREAILEYAEKHHVCPFEFALDLSIWSDFIICDYNYVFDPSSYLRRFFSDAASPGNFVLLIDEAHNLADRSREMFSASLNKRPVLEMKRYTKEIYPGLSRALSAVNKYFIDKSKEKKVKVLDKEYYVSRESDAELNELVEEALLKARDFLDDHPKDDKYEEFLSLYFQMLFFTKIYDMYDEKYCTYIEQGYDDMAIKYYCLDPSRQLSRIFEKVRASVLFSATLMPMDYYFNLLGGNEFDRRLVLGSPFIRENKCIIAAEDISSTYRQRDYYYEKNADYIFRAFSARAGNYIAFFPSYKYMSMVFDIFKAKYPDVCTIIQEKGYTDEKREEFIKKFSPETGGKIGFCVLGGVFSEGIDLKGDSLLGVIIAGVGMPQVCVERELIKEYYNYISAENYEAPNGFNYAYVYPGFTKILQAAGRVIRDENDRGIIMLLDSRYSEERYSMLFPDDWYPVIYTKFEKIDDILIDFW